MLPEEMESAPVETGPAFEPLAAPPVASEELATPEIITLEPAPPERKPFWGYADLAIVLGLLFAFSVVIVAVVALITIPYPKLRTDEAALAMPVQIAFYAAVYLSFWLAFKFHYRKPVLSSLGWCRPRINLFLTAAGGVLLAFAVSALGVLLHTPKIDSPFDKLTSTPLSMAFFGIVAVAFAPFFEELFFRGFLQPLLSRTLGILPGIITTALLFGALHGFEYSWVWQYALLIMLVGVALGLLRARTGSIVPGVFLHGAFNAVSVVALAFGKNI